MNRGLPVLNQLQRTRFLVLIKRSVASRNFWRLLVRKRLLNLNAHAHHKPEAGFLVPILHFVQGFARSIAADRECEGSAHEIENIYCSTARLPCLVLHLFLYRGSSDLSVLCFLKTFDVLFLFLSSRQSSMLLYIF